MVACKCGITKQDCEYHKGEKAASELSIDWGALGKDRDFTPSKVGYATPQEYERGLRRLGAPSEMKSWQGHLSSPWKEHSPPSWYPIAWWSAKMGPIFLRTHLKFRLPTSGPILWSVDIEEKDAPFGARFWIQGEAPSLDLAKVAAEQVACAIAYAFDLPRGGYGV